MVRSFCTSATRSGARLSLGALIAACLLASAAQASAEGRITRAELSSHQRQKADLASVALDNLQAMGTDESGCAQIRDSHNSRERAAWTRVSNGLVADMHHDAKEWAPLEQWGAGLRARAASYTDALDRNRVRSASGDISLGAAGAADALDIAAKVFSDYAAFNCGAGGKADDAHKTFNRAYKRVSDGFEALGRAVGA